MSDIDWSLMPRGATHYREDWHCTSTGGVQYYKKSEDQWAYWGELLGSGWRESEQPIIGFKEIPNKVPKHPVWDGKGLPPIGTVCEVQHESWAKSIWETRTVLWLGNKTVVTQDAGGEEKNGFIHKLTFRPLLTAEQIAEEERETAIDEMVRTALHQSYVITPVQAKIVFERIYDAGYRKVQS